MTQTKTTNGAHPTASSVDTRHMTTEEAGKLGGSRTKQLIQEGKLYEAEHEPTQSTKRKRTAD